MASITAPTPLEALSFGWSVFPLNKFKKPIIGTWKSLQQRHPGADDIDEWSRRPGLAGWATVTGAVSGEIVLDFDGPEGVATMRALGLEPHRMTPSGGYHVRIAHPGFPIKTQRETPKEGKPRPWAGRDCRGGGGYCMYSGRAVSNHSNPPIVREYVWLRDPAEPPYPFEVLPKELQEYLRKTPTSSDADKGNWHGKGNGHGKRVDSELLIRRALEAAPSCGRNNAGFDLGCQLRDNGYSRSETLGIVDNYRAQCAATNTKGNVDPYTAADVRASVDQAYSRPPREPWADTSQDAKQHGRANRGTASPPNDYTVPPPEEPPADLPDPNWRDSLLLNDEGKARACLANILIAFRPL